ncbi:hypothetical protein [Thalassotalea sp. ND16A]|uniref:hypothetical protein n=1 Tax=Thalassotalea sp. ND16A TaxID=1535422 RepID=UPI001269DD0F|nr:hypothetical protein [Thalassotalea sp. ND16A]
MMNLSKILLTILFVLFLGGCSSMKAIDTVHVNSHNELIKHLEVGDEVYIVTKQGKKHEFIVKTINSEVVAGDDIKVSITEIEKINKKGFSWLKTGGLVLGIISIVVVSCCFIVS